MFEMMKPALMAMLKKAADTLENRAAKLYISASCCQEPNLILSLNIRAGIWADLAVMIRESMDQ